MRLDPASTNDHDDDERLVRYLTCQPGSKEEQVNGFVNMVMRRIKKAVASVMSCLFSSTNPDWVDEMHIEQRLSGDFDKI